MTPNVDTTNYKLQSAETIISINTETSGYSQTFTVKPVQPDGAPASQGWRQAFFTGFQKPHTIGIAPPGHVSTDSSPFNGAVPVVYSTNVRATLSG